MAETAANPEMPGGHPAPAPCRHHHGWQRPLGKDRGWPRLVGHRRGAETRQTDRPRLSRSGVNWLTVYAFSTENWKRSTEEVLGLMGILPAISNARPMACRPKACACALSAGATGSAEPQSCNA